MLTQAGPQPPPGAVVLVFGATGSVIAATVSLLRLNIIWKIAGRLDGSGRRTPFYNILERRAMHSQDYRADLTTLLQMVARGDILLEPFDPLPLDGAAQAHRRAANGSLRRPITLALVGRPIAG